MMSRSPLAAAARTAAIGMPEAVDEAGVRGGVALGGQGSGGDPLGLVVARLQRTAELAGGRLAEPGHEGDGEAALAQRGAGVGVVELHRGEVLVHERRAAAA